MKIECYQAYKDSAVKWLGEVPKHWEIYRAKDTIKRIGNGVTPRGGSEVYVDSGIPLLRSQNVYDDGLRIENVSFIPIEIHEEMRNSQLKANDILINITGASIGRTCIVPTNFGAANINQHIAFLRIKAWFNAFYISLFLKSHFIKTYIQIEQNGASKEAFNLNQIANIPLVLPPLKEQKSIATYLDTKTAQIDRKIDLLTQKASSYAELKRSLINETATRGLDKSVPMKHSGVEWIGEVPEHWKVTAVTSITTTVSIKNHPDEKLLSVYRDYGVIVKSTRDDNHNRAGGNLAGYKLVEPGFLVINKMKAWQGSLGVSEFRGIVSPAYITCRTNKRIIERGYLHHLLRCRSYINEYNRLSYGVRVDQWDMRYDDFKYVPILLPPLSEQKAIADYLDTKTAQIDQIIQTINTQIEKLKELRKTLINDVVTGKIRVAEPDYS